MPEPSSPPALALIADPHTSRLFPPLPVVTPSERQAARGLLFENEPEPQPASGAASRGAEMTAMAITAKEMNSRHKGNAEDGLAVSVALC